MQEKKLVTEVQAIEADTGVRVRVLAQNYPETPGGGGGVRWGGGGVVGLVGGWVLSDWDY